MNNKCSFVQRKKLGLVLGGGGVKGLAHIGVLRVLQDSGISISCLSGCSMGGLIASLYAAGIPLDQIEIAARKFNSRRELLKLVDRAPSRKGLLVGKSVRKYLSEFISPDFPARETRIPLTLNAIDLVTTKEVLLTDGYLLDNIMATTAVPGFFPPVEVDSFKLVDGGILNNVPVEPILTFEPEYILAVDVHHNAVDNVFGLSNHLLPIPEFVQDFYRAETIMTIRLTNLNLKTNPPDMLVRPLIPLGVSLFWGFHKVDEIIEAGRQAMLEQLPVLIKQLV